VTLFRGDWWRRCGSGWSWQGETRKPFPVSTGLRLFSPPRDSEAAAERKVLLIAIEGLLAIVQILMLDDGEIQRAGA